MVPGTYYRGRVWLILALCWPGLALAVPAALTQPGLAPFQPQDPARSSRVPGPYVSIFKDGAVPRSHFYGTPPVKVPNLFCFSR